ncbi:MAG: LacI family DNA-binding transcriptional regulator [Acutalibacteraceae bacterium]
MNGKRATIKDVARLAGVSISTASLAINGKGGCRRKPGRWYWMQ